MHVASKIDSYIKNLAFETTSIFARTGELNIETVLHLQRVILDWIFALLQSCCVHARLVHWCKVVASVENHFTSARLLHKCNVVVHVQRNRQVEFKDSHRF